MDIYSFKLDYHGQCILKYSIAIICSWKNITILQYTQNGLNWKNGPRFFEQTSLIFSQNLQVIEKKLTNWWCYDMICRDMLVQTVWKKPNHIVKDFTFFKLLQKFGSCFFSAKIIYAPLNHCKSLQIVMRRQRVRTNNGQYTLVFSEH